MGGSDPDERLGCVLYFRVTDLSVRVLRFQLVFFLPRLDGVGQVIEVFGQYPGSHPQPVWGLLAEIEKQVTVGLFCSQGKGLQYQLRATREDLSG